MSNYPDWVNAFKRKGTSIKKVGNSYYLYKSTSKRVKGKKYPQPVQTFIGTITEEGVKPSNIKKVSTGKVYVYEYGFSYALKKIIPAKFFRDIRNAEKAEHIFLNIIKHFSPGSYLLRGICLPSPEELHISLSVQIRKIERLCKLEMEELKPLMNLYLVDIDGNEMISAETEEIAKTMEKIGVKNYDL